MQDNLTIKTDGVEVNADCGELLVLTGIVGLVSYGIYKICNFVKTVEISNGNQQIKIETRERE